MVAADSLQAHTQHATAVRHLSEAIAAPTLHALVAAHGTAQTGATVIAMVTGAMEYFAPNRRMNSAQIGLFAEDILDRYRHESLADVALFMRGCALSKYDEGEFYANVDVPRLNKWWTRYLDEKAAERELGASREEHLLEQGMKETLANVPGLTDLVNTMRIENKEKAIAEEKTSRMRKLTEQLPKMSDEDLRGSWKFYTTAEERSLILGEAKERGLLEAKIKELGLMP